MAQFAERSELLRPVARHSAADGDDAKLLLAQQRGGKVLEVFEGIEANFVPAGGFAQPIVESCIQTQFLIAERGHENRHTHLMRRLQNSPLLAGMLRQECADGVV